VILSIFWVVTLERKTSVEADREIKSTLELILVNDELLIFKESKEVAFNKQKEFEDLGHEIWLAITLFIKRAETSEMRNKGEFIFSNTESVIFKDPELTVKMNASASLESMFVT